MIKKTLLPFLLILCGLTILRAQQAARIVQEDTMGWLRYESDPEGNFIPDFSYAGYRRGEAPLPDVRVVRTISPIAGDNTAHIQAALDEVAALPLDAGGLRGAVLLTAGRYPLRGSLQVNADGVVLRGVGQGSDPATNTILVGEGNTPQQRNLVTVGGSPGVSWNSARAGSRVNILDPLIPTGARTVRVATPEQFSVGDNVIVFHPSTNAWLASINFGDTASDEPWRPGQLDMVFNRTITAIHPQSGQLTLDAPVYDRLEQRLAQAQIYVLDAPGIRRNTGVEELRIEINSSGPLNKDHVRTAVFLRGVEDAWVRNVTALRFSYACVDMEVASRVTVTGCSGLDPHSPVVGGERYNFAVNFQSNNILFTNCTGSNGRHTFVSNAASTGSGIVFHNSRSSGDLAASEGHRRWSQGLLFDQLVFTDPEVFTVLGLYNRGSFGTGHGWAAVNSVAWNVSVAFPRNIILQKPPGRQNYAVGCQAFITSDGTFDFPEGYTELIRQRPLITSLYTTQLQKRLANGPLPDPAAAVTATQTTNGVLIEWHDVAADETAYEVFWSTDGGISFQSLVRLPANAVSFTHTSAPQNTENIRYRIVTIRDEATAPPSAHARVREPVTENQAIFATYFDGTDTGAINRTNSAGSVTTFATNADCQTLRLSVRDPDAAPLPPFSPYAIRVQTPSGEAITNLTDRVSIGVRMRSRAAVTFSALFRSGTGDADERTALRSFQVPGDTSRWTAFTLEFGADDLAGFNPADLRDCWFFLDRGTENFAGNLVEFDYIVIGGSPDQTRLSPCVLTSTLTAERLASSFRVFPNPVKERLHVRLLNAEVSIGRWRIRNLTGSVLASGSSLPPAGIPMSHYPGGVYFLEIQTPRGGSVLRKIIH